MANALTRRFFIVIVVAVATLALCVPALAQEEPAEEVKMLDEPLLEEIVVTAQKREETVKEIPVSVTALPQSTLGVLTAGGADVKFLSGRVPSVIAESSFGRAFPRFYIRGLGNTDFDLNASQPVSMYYDEVVLENPVVRELCSGAIRRPARSSSSPSNHPRSSRPTSRVLTEHSTRLTSRVQSVAG
jgi:iron complex outermembrane receptor protein